MNFTYEFTLNKGSKVKIENFIGTKIWRKILEGLKRKVCIFIGTKNIFNPFFYDKTKVDDFMSYLINHKYTLYQKLFVGKFHNKILSIQLKFPFRVILHIYSFILW